MRKSTLSLSIVLVLSLVILACNLPFFSAASQNPGLVATSVAQTVAAVIGQPTSNPTLAPQIPTLTPAPAQPTASIPTAVLPPTSTPLPCNWAKLISETYVDGTTFNINTNFNKSWRVKNIGTCTWNANYRIVFHSGSGMGGPASKNFSGNVAPGETIDLILPLKVPGTAGTYKGIWHLYGDDNVDFTQAYGIWVSINAVNPASAFAVTSVTTTVNSPLACAALHTFTANITTSAAGTVTYYWTLSDGTNSSPQSLPFTAAGTKPVQLTWAPLVSGAWAKLYIDNPNHQYFNQVTVTCP